MRTPAIGQGLIALLAAVALGALAAGPAPAAPTAGDPLEVVSPHDDQLVRGRAVRVKLRLAPGATLRRADLNGTNVRGRFKRRGRLVTATLSKRRDGAALRKGRNFLHVTVRRGKKGKKRSETISFTRVVPSRTLIARFRAGHQAREGLRTTVIPSRLSARVRVTLNGRNVSRHFRKGTPLRRAVRLGASDGLRHGANRLRVLAFDFHGGYTTRRRVVRVSPRTTIAGAGPDRRIEAGGAIRLDGRDSRPAMRRDGRVRAGKLRFRWRIVRKPHRSRARLARRTRARPVLRTDLPGTYRLELRASQPSGGVRRTTSVDTVEVTAEPQPMAAVSTFATVGGASGIAVEASRECRGAKAAAKPPCFYPNPGKASDLQAVVLDRETLEPVSNAAYAADDLSEFTALMKRFATEQKGQKCGFAYDTDKLVLLALREGSIAAEALAPGLAYVNTSSKDCSPEAPSRTEPYGPFSAIAVPGTLAGKMWINDGNAIEGAAGELGAAGSLDGYFKPSADDPTRASATRSFAFGEEIPFDTRGEDGSTLTIGSKSVSLAGLPPGLAIFSFDPVNPESTLKLEKTITNTGGEAGAGLDWEQMDYVFVDHPTVPPRAGWAIVSTGKIGGFATEPKAGYFTRVLDSLEGIGANPDVFARAVNQNGTYSMVATDDYATDRVIAYDSSSVKADGVPEGSGLPVGAGRLTGVLLRGSDTATFPTEADPSGLSPQPGFRSLLYSEPTGWQLTPAPEAGTASCQETALAYVIEQVAEAFPPNAAPKLWKDARRRACQGIPHPETGAGRAADSLEGDGCASQEATAIGAIGPNVRRASLALRDRYASLTYDLSEAKVEAVSLPAGAPFTAADLACAKNQLVDELSARATTRRFFAVLQEPQNDLQGKTVVELDRIAEEVKTGALASIAAKLHESESSTASFWAAFGLDALSGMGSIISVFEPETAIVKAAMGFGKIAGAAGSTVLTAVEGPPGNPAANADEYILLAAQIEREQIDLEAQIEDVLTAQENGATRALEIVESDPARLATVAAKANGEWSIDDTKLELAQQIYTYRVRQLAYGDFLPQVYKGVRVNYTNVIQQDLFRWDDGAWRPWAPPSALEPPLESSRPEALTGAGQSECAQGIGGPERNLSAADPGTPVGLGIGNEYRPQLSVAASGETPRYLDYLMLEPGTVKDRSWPTLADAGTVTAAFEQPVKPNGAANPNAAGAYAPDFWFQNLGLVQTMHCNSEGMSIGPTEYLAYGDGDLWPTPTNVAG